MGGCSSTEEGPRDVLSRPSSAGALVNSDSSRSRVRSTGSLDEGHESLQEKIRLGLTEKKTRLGTDSFSFTKIILKLGTVHRVLQRICAVFNAFDHDGSGFCTRSEFKKAMHHVHAVMDDKELDEMFNISDFDGRGALDLRQFIVMLALSDLLRTIPDLTETSDSVHAHQIEGSLGGWSGESDGKEEAGDIAESEAAGAVDGHQVPPPLPAAAAAVDAVGAAEAYTPNGGSGSGSGSGSKRRLSFDMSTAGGFSPIEENDDNQLANEDSLLPQPPRPMAMASIGENEERQPSSVGVEMSIESRQIQRAQEAEAAGVALQEAAKPVLAAVKWKKVPSMVKIPSSGKFEAASDEEDMMHANRKEVAYVMDLIIAAYLQFDTEAKGYIERASLMKQLSAPEGEGARGGGGGFFEQEKWDAMDWDARGRLSFEEFVFTFSQWIDVEEDEYDFIETG